LLILISKLKLENNRFTGHNPEIPPELKTDWVNELSAEVWLPGLSDAAKESIAKGGYYTHEVKPGLVVIAINNNFCYHMNWYGTLFIFCVIY